MTIGAVIFDLDGTLVDSLDDLADSVNAALAERGLPTHARDAYRYFVGDGIPALVRRALGERGDAASLEACVSAVRREYATRWDRKTRPYAGMVEALAALRARGVRLAVLSNKPHALVMKIVERFFAAGAFYASLGAESGFDRKPDPRGAIEVARRLDVMPKRCMYVGDSSIDMQTARAASMLPVGAVWGFRGAAELLDSGATHLVESPDAIVALVDSCG